MSASNSALAALIAGLGPVATPAEPGGAGGLGPWIAARYRGKCSGCGSGFEEFTDIRADGEGGWLARCCGGEPEMTPARCGFGRPLESLHPGDRKAVAEFGELLASTYRADLAADNARKAREHGAPASIVAELDAKAEAARVAVPADAQPEPCHRCGEPTRVRVGGRPQHGGCSPRPASTVAEMREVLSALDASRPRSVQTALGPSELGTPCQRQIAMKLAGVARQLPDKRPPWAPMQGTAMHTLMEEALRFHNAQLGRERWVIEDELQIDDDIPGHGDAFDTDTGTVIDWKYVGVTALREVKRKTVPNEQLVKPDYRVQAHLYGYGHARKGRDVRWVRLVFLARSHDFGDSAEWTEPYDPAIAEEAIQRYHATKALVTGLPLAATPALWAVVPAAPSEKTCAWCPFHRPGGPADTTGCPGYERTIKDHQDLLANIK